MLNLFKSNKNRYYTGSDRGWLLGILWLVILVIIMFYLAVF